MLNLILRHISIRKGKYILGFIIIITALTRLFPGPESKTPKQDVLLKVPVRIKAVSNTRQAITGLKASDFSLRINGVTRAINDFAALERSLVAAAGGSNTNRAIALSFDVSLGNRAVIDGLSEFIRRVLTPGDTLLLRTPVDVYTFPENKGKEQVIQLIHSILENDLLQRKREKQDAIDSLNNLIRDAEQKLDRKKMGIRSALLFATHFHEQWRKFYKQFLIANLEFFASLTERTASFNGDKWLVHVQERTTLSVWKNFQRIHKKLNAFASRMSKDSSAGQTLQDTLDKVDRSMFFKSGFPVEELLNNLLGVNLGCHMILHADSNEKPETSGIKPVYETVLSTIAHHTGGTTVIANENNIKQALDEILIYKDFFYRLVFAFNGTAEDKTLDITVNRPGVEAYYKKLFKAGEFQWLMKHLGMDELKVDDYSLNANNLEFAIYGSGILKVDVCLVDSSGNAVFQTSKTLNAAGPSTAISLKLPPEYKGYFKLSISARDQRTQKSVVMNQYIKL